MSLVHWTQWLIWMAAEAAALVAGAGFLQAWLRSPRARRTIWRATLIAVTLIWMVELSGIRRLMPGPGPNRQHDLVIAAADAASAPQSRAGAPSAGAQLAPAPASAPEVVKWPAWIWLAGSMLLLARSFAARVWLVRRRRAALPAGEESRFLIELWQTSLGLRGVQSQVWPGLRGPIAFGVFRPAIALPPDFGVRFSFAEREAMLAHEMAHLAARDPVWLTVSDAAVALAWWHPLVWWARHRLRSATEAAADEASALVPGGAQALAESLVRLAREMTESGPAHALGIDGRGPRSQLADRIQRLLRGPRLWQPAPPWARWTPQVTAVLAAAACAILPIQTGLSGSIFAVLATPTLTPARADGPPAAPRLATADDRSNTPAVPTPTTNRPDAVSLSCQALFVTEHSADDIGLDWVFGKAPDDNPSVELSRDWKDLGFSAGNHRTNLVIDRLRTVGQSAILKPEQFAALLDRLRSTGNDILSSPKLLTFSGRRGRVSIRQSGNYVTGVEATNGFGTNSSVVNYTTDSIDLGFSIDIVSTHEADDRWRLEVRASETAFMGYDKYGKDVGSVRYPGGKPLEYAIPHPHFRAVATDSDDTLLLGQTLALRGPLWTEVTQTKGHFFFPGKTQTTRQRLYVFVTPGR